VIPLVPRTARTIDLAIGERHEGPILRRRDGERRPENSPPMGSFNRPTSRSRVNPPAHASGSLHHGGA
jgi:hypothetical protein